MKLMNENFSLLRRNMLGFEMQPFETAKYKRCLRKNVKHKRNSKHIKTENNTTGS